MALAGTSRATDGRVRSTARENTLEISAEGTAVTAEVPATYDPSIQMISPSSSASVGCDA
jgi:hypothetical protein